MAGLCLIAAGVCMYVPGWGRATGAFLILAGVFILVPFPIHG